MQDVHMREIVVRIFNGDVRVGKVQDGIPHVVVDSVSMYALGRSLHCHLHVDLRAKCKARPHRN